MEISEEKIEKLEALAFLVAVIDGITTREIDELRILARDIRAYYPLRKAIEVHEKTGDIEKAMTHVKERPRPMNSMTVQAKGTKTSLPEHIGKILDELDDAVKDSENQIVEYDALLKIKAAEINEEFDQKISLLFIEEAISEGDGMHDAEEHALVTLSRAWGITMDQVYEWDRDHFYPVLERASEL